MWFNECTELRKINSLLKCRYFIQAGMKPGYTMVPRDRVCEPLIYAICNVIIYLHSASYGLASTPVPRFDRWVELVAHWCFALLLGGRIAGAGGCL